MYFGYFWRMLGHFGCDRYFEDSNLYAKRWQRREPQTLTVLKKAVLDSTTTDVARRFQFQAFDLDGNGTISKSEMDMMLTLVRGEVPSPEEVEEIMVKADPAPRLPVELLKKLYQTLTLELLKQEWYWLVSLLLKNLKMA